MVGSLPSSQVQIHQYIPSVLVRVSPAYQIAYVLGIDSSTPRDTDG